MTYWRWRGWLVGAVAVEDQAFEGQGETTEDLRGRVEMSLASYVDAAIKRSLVSCFLLVAALKVNNNINNAWRLEGPRYNA